MLALLMLLAVPCAAREVVIAKTITPDLLQAELVAGGFQVDSINCLGGKCWAVLPDSETKDPAPIIAAHAPVNRDATRQAMLDELESIEIKLDDGTATPAETRRAVKLMMKLNGLARRP